MAVNGARQLSFDSNHPTVRASENSLHALEFL